jgi:hypothetical protein
MQPKKRKASPEKLAFLMPQTHIKQATQNKIIKHKEYYLTHRKRQSIIAT